MGRAGLALLALLEVITPAEARDDPESDEYRQFNQPWRIYVGAFNAAVDSRLTVDGQNLGTVIDIENVLLVDDSDTTAWGGAVWQFARRHSVEFEMFSLNRNGGADRTFSPPVELRDLIIEAGAVSTSYDTDIARLTYGFSAIRTDRSNFKLKAGLHRANLEAQVQVAGSICSPETTPSEPPGCPTNQTGGVGERVTAPLPHFGVAWEYALSPTWAIDVGVIGFALEVDDINGSIIEVDADITWQPWKHFGLGLGARYFTVDVEEQRERVTARFDFEYLGPVLFVQATF